MPRIPGGPPGGSRLGASWASPGVLAGAGISWRGGARGFGARSWEPQASGPCEVDHAPVPRLEALGSRSLSSLWVVGCSTASCDICWKSLGEAVKRHLGVDLALGGLSPRKSGKRVSDKASTEEAGQSKGQETGSPARGRLDGQAAGYPHILQGRQEDPRAIKPTSTPGLQFQSLLGP